MCIHSASVPLAPASVTVVPANDTSLVVEWIPTVNDQTRRFVVRYNIVYGRQRDRPENEESLQVPGDTSMAVITSLEPYTTYRVRVRAETLTETGQYSLPIHSSTCEEIHVFLILSLFNVCSSSFSLASRICSDIWIISNAVFA